MRLSVGALCAFFLVLCGCGGSGDLSNSTPPQNRGDGSNANYGIRLVSGTGPLGPGSAIIIHGLFDNYNDVAFLADKLRPRIGWANVYSLDYQWLRSTSEVATYLGSVLDQHRSDGKRIDLIGYSRGGLIARYTLEKLGKTHAVRNCFLICTPNQGSWAANAARLITLLNIIWLAEGHIGNPMIRESHAIVKELLLDSPFLRDLNTPNYSQRGEVNYYIFGGERDLLMSHASSQASDVNLEAITNGGVNRSIIPGASHWSIKSDESQIAFISHSLPLNLGSDVTVSFDPNPARVWTNGWLWFLNIRNDSDQNIVLKTISFDSYNKNGTWLGCTWYDPHVNPGVYFPPEYRNCDIHLRGHQRFGMYLFDAADRNQYSGKSFEEVPIEMRARTLIHNVVYVKNGIQHQDDGRLNEFYQDLRPAPAQTRSRDSRQIDNGAPAIRLMEPAVIR